MLRCPPLCHAPNAPLRAARLRAASARRFHGSRGPAAGQTASERLLYGILGLNTAVFVAWKYADNTIPIRVKSEQLDLSKPRVFRAMVDNFIFKPQDLDAGRWWTAVTHAFSHKDLPHFIFNFIALKSFGEAVISYLPGIRPVSLAALYLGAGLAGSAGWYAQSRQDARRDSAGALGASGAVSGLAAAAALIAPRAQWQLMFIPIGIPAWALFSAYIAYDAFYLNDPNSRIGHSSHISGAAFGAVYYLTVLRRFRLR